MEAKILDKYMKELQIKVDIPDEFMSDLNSFLKNYGIVLGKTIEELKGFKLYAKKNYILMPDGNYYHLPLTVYYPRGDTVQIRQNDLKAFLEVQHIAKEGSYLINYLINKVKKSGKEAEENIIGSPMTPR